MDGIIEHVCGSCKYLHGYPETLKDANMCFPQCVILTIKYKHSGNSYTHWCCCKKEAGRIAGVFSPFADINGLT